MSGAILWLRRDLRLADHPALWHAARQGPVAPLFIVDRKVRALGAAASWRLGQALSTLDAALRQFGSRLTLRAGEPADVITSLAREIRADRLHLSRGLRDPDFAFDGLHVEVHPGNSLLPPGVLRTRTGGAYRVFTPFWRALRDRDIAPPLPAPAHIPAPDRWPEGLALADCGFGTGMNRGAAVLARFATPGEEAASARPHDFLRHDLAGYAEARDRPDRQGCSGLSEALAVGEISARQIWHAGRTALHDGVPGAESFLSELGWREFARDLFFHAPDLPRRPWQQGWDSFPWRPDNDDAEAWRRGETGVEIVDAGMREMFATGRMHNRVRMIVASYLTKHLLTDWRVGLDWFAECLTDWDAASNAMNWQWVAGCGPDAAPFFRIFNPETQAAKFDPQGRYRRHWLHGEGAQAFLDAAPRSWNLSADAPRPKPRIGLDEGRVRALAAYQEMRASGEGDADTRAYATLREARTP